MEETTGRIEMNRINIITLGVRDIARSVRFYRDGLGFQTEEKGASPGISFFNMSGTKFALYPLSALVEDTEGENPPKIAEGFAGITLAYNCKNESEVREVIEQTQKAGAVIAKEPQKCFGAVITLTLPTRMAIIGKWRITLPGSMTRTTCSYFRCWSKSGGTTVKFSGIKCKRVQFK